MSNQTNNPSSKHLVIPGQIIASSNNDEQDNSGFLRGHGTYIKDNDTQTNESMEDNSTSLPSQTLIASVAGTI